MTPEEYINKVKKDRWHAVSGGWLGTFVTEEDALAAIKLTRKEMKAKEVAPIKCEKKSPITGGEMQLMQEKSSVKFRDEEITFIKKFYHCVDSGQDFTDTELDNDNMWAIFRAYWERRGFEHFYDIDGYRKEEKSALNRADIIHSEQYKVSRASVDWYLTHQDTDCLDGFEAGAKWQREQMIKDAIDAEVAEGSPMPFQDSIPVLTNTDMILLSKDKFRVGDKVKVIIIKE